MTPERFQQLADAYGGSVARWPEAERNGAAELMAAAPDQARILLDQAASLDALLDSWTPLRVSDGLRARVLEGAPQPRAGGFRTWIWRAGAGAGLAAACAAGLSLGVVLNARSASDPIESVSAVMVTYEGPLSQDSSGGGV